jgi:hypothetical protein
MKLAIIDDEDDIFVQYNEDIFKKLLMKYFEIHKDIERAFDQLSIDLIEKARTKK